MADTPSFGAWLRRRRKALDLTQDGLAQLVGCSVVSIRKFESDEQRPSRQMAERLAAQLQLPTEQHLTFVRFARGGLDAVPPALPTSAAILPTQSAATPIVSATQGSLPTRLSSFIGRVTEQRELLTLLARPVVRLVTLTGPGGAGKTSLAVQVASQLQPAYPDGIWFVDLAPISDPHLVATTIAQTLGIPERTQTTILAAVQSWLRTKQALLVLDNFEQVLDAAPTIIAILSVAPAVKALITSRAVLQVQGEHEYPLAALALPPRIGAGGQAAGIALSAMPDAAGTTGLPGSSGSSGSPGSPGSRTSVRPTLADVAGYEAIALFVERAQSVQPAFMLSEQNAAAIIDICTRLDGLPLAIELAAARVRFFPPEALQQRLAGNNVFATLTSKARDLPNRQQTIRATIAWSYDLLHPAEQAILMRLGVFVGGWSIPAAEAVCRDVGSDVVECITALVDHNLVRVVTTTNQPRFTMLETIREYALEQLQAARLFEQTQERHARYFFEQANQLGAAYNTHQEKIWLELLEPERDNIRAVNQWAFTTGRREFAQRFNGSLFALWIFRGGNQIEARQVLKATLTLAERGNPTPDAQVAEALALAVAGYLALNEPDYADAEALFTQELHLYEAINNQPGIAEAYRGLGYTIYHSGEFDRAWSFTSQSLAISHAANDELGIAWSLFDLGIILFARGDILEAQQQIEQAIPKLHKQGISYGVFRAHFILGHILFAQGNNTKAREHYNTSLRMQQQMGYTQPMEALYGLAVLAGSEGIHYRAAVLFAAEYANRQAIGYALSPYQVRSYQTDLTFARDQLTPAEWQAAWDEGISMPLGQAVGYALDEKIHSG